MADLALRVQAAAHAFGQGAGDGQAQAGAAVAPRGGGVGLFEGVEHVLQAVGSNADAGVLHRAGQPEQLLTIQQLPAGGDGDAAGFGELQRVADQVDQNLPQAGGVAAHLDVVQPRLGVHAQLQAALLGARAEHLNRAGDQLGQSERNVLQLQRAALDA
ncbi:hypothetical protein D3C78_498580 [compost metagenome]